ncbi:MAG: HAS-barrel domain-containing protein [Methanomicrobiaceae archaeon]|nr:HAS-barrel domain-containing protein [Methanomicrobiaceae archaeon]
MTPHTLMAKEFRTVTYVSGPLIFVERPKGVSFGEIARIRLPDGEERTGQVLDISRDLAIVQVYEGTSGIDDLKTTVLFTGLPPRIDVSYDMLGRIFTGVGIPRDGGPPVIPEDTVDIGGTPMNPYARDKPEDFILAIVQFHEDGSHSAHYLRQPFNREPDFGVTSVNYDFAELLARAEEPR